MLAHTHIAIGISAALFMVNATESAPPTATEFFFLLLGCLAPDIDSNTSVIGKPGQVLERFLPKPARKALDAVGGAITKSINHIFGHRGLFHWPLLAVVFVGLGLWLDKLWVCWFGFGYFFHILGDFFTPQGTPFFAPLHTKCVSMGSIKTGSWLESLLGMMLCFYVCYSGFQFLPTHTKHWLRRYATLAHVDLDALGLDAPATPN